MIKFFRKIRQNMIKENKVSKYMLYAIGEIILVVIGILIALSINNWNEERAKQAEINTYLLNLVQNLKSDVASMNRLESVNVFRFYSLQYLLELSGEVPYDEQTDELNAASFNKNDIWEAPLPTVYDEKFIRLAFLWSHRNVDQNLNQSTINELKSTGMFSYLNNISLKNAINSYYKKWKQRIGETNQQTHREIILNWQASLGEEGVLTSNVFSLEDPLDLLRNNKNRVYLMKRLIREAAWVMRCAKRTRDEANALILQIENELIN